MAIGENATIHNQYNQISIAFHSDNGIVLNIEARVFDDNLAFRYLLSGATSKTAMAIVKENTGFNFASQYSVYRHNTESVFSPTPINELKNPSDFPGSIGIIENVCMY